MAEIVNGYTLDEQKKGSTCGWIGTATKDGKRYFVKIFNAIVEPSRDGSMSPKVVEQKQKLFDDFKRRKLRVNKKLREIAAVGGNIIFPVSEGTYNHHWIEFTEMLDGVVPDDQYYETISKLDEESRQLSIRVAMGALDTIHKARIVHGDLKLTNIMLVKNQYGTYVSKIIDFDGAFFEDDVPLDGITGTMDYYSPELALYSMYEEPEQREKIAKNITTKSDIFTMGLVLHEYLTGKKPGWSSLPEKYQEMHENGKVIYPWQIAMIGKEEFQLKLDAERIVKPEYVALISDMLCRNPEKRPGSSEVVRRLQTMELPIETEVWPEDALTIDAERVKGRYLGLRKDAYKDETKKEVHCYEVIARDGQRHRKTAEQLISEGIASPGERYEDPRPEDRIAWTEKLKADFLSVRPGDAPSQYILVEKTGRVRRLDVSVMKMMKWAVSTDGRASTPPSPPPPIIEKVMWPEDAGLKINKEKLTATGFTFEGRVEKSGKHAYAFKDNNGNQRYMASNVAKAMKFFV